MSGFLITLVGLLAQLFFSLRILYQWIKSERAKKIISPALFWVFSIIGSYLLFIYGWLRDDFSIILGQFLSYYIYLWNLKANNILQKLPYILRIILFITPLIAIGFMLYNFSEVKETLFQNKDIPIWLIIFGSLGQIIFTFRFIYQWIYSLRKHISILPMGFWVISLVGSIMIISYGIIRQDIVLILGQSTGFIAYTRNIMIGHKSKI
ncbi:MAG: lipid-A-disaccharide synthase N-terminal domain-containing protein [Bacteroidetes bacterium]|nr:lipid-A-disaccharide synthase N-terminal domain-containing protein [Bacteroidota bacterium]